MTTQIRLDNPVVLPGVEDARDECVSRLISLLEGREGIDRVHIVEAEGDKPGTSPGLLCLHYDAERIPLGQIQDIVLAAGAKITNRFAHEVVPIHFVGAEDDGQRIEAAIRAVPGDAGWRWLATRSRKSL